MEVTIDQLELVSRILRTRLTRPTTVDTVILSPNDVRSSKLSDHFGRYIGAFGLRPNSHPYFGLFCKPDPISDPTDLYIYYLRTNYTKIQRSELLIMAEFEPKIKSDTIKIGVVNVRPTSPKLSDLSSLLQTIEYSIGPNLIRDYVSKQTTFTYGSSFVAFNKCLPSTDNCIMFNTPTYDRLFDALTQTGRECIRDLHLDEDHPLVSSFDVAQVLYEGHYLYLVRLLDNFIQVIIPHSHQFSHHESFNRFENLIKMTNKNYKLIASRYYGATDGSCLDTNWNYVYCPSSCRLLRWLYIPKTI